MFDAWQWGLLAFLSAIGAAILGWRVTGGIGLVMISFQAGVCFAAFIMIRAVERRRRR